jgi:hypothetical protein
MFMTFLLTILLSLFSLGGIGQTQNIALETNKKSQVFEIEKLLQDYYIDNASYPVTLSIEGNTLFLDNEEIEIKENIDENKWKVCYRLDSKTGNYAVGIELSDEDWFVLSPADLECDESDLI